MTKTPVFNLFSNWHEVCYEYKCARHFDLINRCEPPSIMRLYRTYLRKFQSLQAKLLGLVVGIVTLMTALNMVITSSLTSKHHKEEAYRKLELQLTLFRKELEEHVHGLHTTAIESARDVKNLNNLALLYAQKSGNEENFRLSQIASLHQLQLVLSTSEISGVAVYVNKSLNHYFTRTRVGLLDENQEIPRWFSTTEKHDGKFTFQQWRSWKDQVIPSFIPDSLAPAETLKPSLVFRSEEIVFQIQVPVRGSLRESFGSTRVDDPHAATSQDSSLPDKESSQSRIIGTFVFFSIFDHCLLREQADKLDAWPAIYSLSENHALELNPLLNTSDTLRALSEEAKPLFTLRVAQSGEGYHQHLTTWSLLPDSPPLVLAVALPQEEIVAMVRQTGWGLFWVALLMLGLGIGGGILYIRQIMIPVHALSQAAKQLAHGNFDITLHSLTHDEIGYLGATFMRMSRRIARQIRKIHQEILIRREAEDELRQHRDHLEELVRERTNELIAANEQLQELNASKDKFFSIIAHDLRGPFSTLLMMTEFVLESFETMSQSDLKYKLERMQVSAERLLTLLQNLLTWARIQRGAIQYEPVSFDLAAVVEDNLLLLESRADHKGVTLTNGIQTELQVYGDPQMVDTILRNLFSNAMKFTERGGSIHVSADVSGKMVDVLVADTGCGINEAGLSKIFRIDAQYTRTGTEGERGSGLGLVLCRELVEQQGGSIRVDSIVGEGTTFRFTLPHPT